MQNVQFRVGSARPVRNMSGRYLSLAEAFWDGLVAESPAWVSLLSGYVITAVIFLILAMIGRNLYHPLWALLIGLFGVAVAAARSYAVQSEKKVLGRGVNNALCIVGVPLGLMLLVFGTTDTGDAKVFVGVLLLFTGVIFDYIFEWAQNIILLTHFRHISHRDPRPVALKRYGQQVAQRLGATLDWVEVDDKSRTITFGGKIPGDDVRAQLRLAAHELSSEFDVQFA